MNRRQSSLLCQAHSHRQGKLLCLRFSTKHFLNGGAPADRGRHLGAGLDQRLDGAAVVSGLTEPTMFGAMDRPRQRRPAKIGVTPLERRAEAQHGLDHLQVAMKCGPVQRCRLVLSLPIHGQAALEQPANHGRLVVPGRVSRLATICLGEVVGEVGMLRSHSLQDRIVLEPACRRRRRGSAPG